MGDDTNSTSNPQNFQKKHLKKAMFFSRVIGTMPYSEVTSPDGSDTRLVWKWNSWASLCTLLLDSLLIGTVLYGSVSIFTSVKITQSSWCISRILEYNINILLLLRFYWIQLAHKLIFTLGKTRQLQALKDCLWWYCRRSIRFCLFGFLCPGVSSTSSILKLIEEWDNFEAYFSKFFTNMRNTNLFAAEMREANVRGFFALIIIPVILVMVNFTLKENYCYSPIQELNDGLHHETRERKYISNVGQIICTCGTMLPLVNMVLSFGEDFKSIVFIRIIANSFLQVCICAILHVMHINYFASLI